MYGHLIVMCDNPVGSDSFAIHLTTRYFHYHSFAIHYWGNFISCYIRRYFVRFIIHDCYLLRSYFSQIILFNLITDIRLYRIFAINFPNFTTTRLYNSIKGLPINNINVFINDLLVDNSYQI